MQREIGFRWFIVGLIFMILTINYIDRISMSFAILQISKVFHLNTIQKAYIFSAFSIGFSLSMVASIWLVSRFGANRVMMVAGILWSLSTFYTGLAQNFFTLVLSRLCLGLSEGPNFPCLTNVIYNWLLPNERTRAFAVSLVSIPFAFALSGPLVTLLIHFFSWQTCFFTLGILGIIMIILWFIFYHEKPYQSIWLDFNELKALKDNSTKIKKHNFQKRSFIDLIQNKEIVSNLFAHFVFGFYLYFFIFWIPQYLDEIYQFKLVKISLYSSLMWGISGIGLLIFSFFIDSLYAKIKNFNLVSYYSLRFLHAGAGLFLLPMLMISNPNLDTLFLTLALTCMMTSAPLYYTYTINLLHENASEVMGFSGFLFAISGIISPIVTGWMLKLTNSFHFMFVFIACLAILSSLIGFLSIKKEFD